MFDNFNKSNQWSNFGANQQKPNTPFSGSSNTPFSLGTSKPVSANPTGTNGFERSTGGNSFPGFPSTANQSSGFPMNSNSAWSMGGNNFPGGSKGTAGVPYSETKITENYESLSLVDIACMPHYDKKSVDMLRLEDYLLGRKVPNTMGISGTQFPTHFNSAQPGLNGTGFIVNSPSSNINPLGSSNINPIGSSNINPLGSSSINPIGSSNINPIGSSNINPLGSSNINPLGSSSINPLGFTNTNPLGSFVQQQQNSTPNSFQVPQKSFTQPLQNSSFPSTSNSLGNVASGGNNQLNSSNFPTNNFLSTPSQPPQQPFKSSFPPQPFSTQPPAAVSNQPQSTTGNSTYPSFISPPSGLVQPQYIQNTQSANNTAVQSVYIDEEDPYAFNGIFMPKTTPALHHPKPLIPKPVFPKSDSKTSFDVSVRPPNRCEYHEVCLIPENYHHMEFVHNLVVVIKGRGRIEYFDPIKVSEIRTPVNIKVVDNTVYMTDPIGFGLNRGAKVFLENVFPSTNKINGIELSLEQFIYQLRSKVEKDFVSYDEIKGIYIYKVKHF